MSRGAAFVVGGSGGLGGAICRRLAQEWPAVVVGYAAGAEAAAALSAELSTVCTSVALRCDLRDPAGPASAIDDAVRRFDGIGAMVFAGGVRIAQPFVGDIKEADWREVFEVELIGFTRVVAATLPHFRAAGGGAFVSVVSVANYSYPPGDALSAVPKAGIESLGRAIAREEGRHGIRCNMVAPGIIDAGLGAQFLQELYTPEIWETQRKRVALRRFGSGAEIADAVAFLASDRASYITGQTLVVDGGFSI
jgi:NAD(P)-dependent dehydrogenase (short-subunit alcohol dehydrogenase family)